jgi:hypothetical protein
MNAVDTNVLIDRLDRREPTKQSLTLPTSFAVCKVLVVVESRQHSPKDFNDKAQGRAAHPGIHRTKTPRNPERVRQG